MITRLGYLADLSPACRTHDQLPRLCQLSRIIRDPLSIHGAMMSAPSILTMWIQCSNRRWHVRLRQASIKISLKLHYCTLYTCMVVLSIFVLLPISVTASFDGLRT
jgi:hypothetical protein